MFLITITSQAVADQECSRALYIKQLAETANGKTLSGEEHLDRNSNLTVDIEAKSEIKVDRVALTKNRDAQSKQNVDGAYLDCSKEIAKLD